MKWIADVITTDIDKYEKLLVEHLKLGAAAAYLWGGASDEDFVYVGMFDCQVKHDVELTRNAVAESKNRKRPWIA